MADDGDDFVFDEDGIYRERALDTDQDFLDEDGIWRDDDDDDDEDYGKDQFGRYTFRTDSGLGTTERRSSLSTFNNRVSGSLADLPNYRITDHDDDDDEEDDFGEHSHLRQGSLPLGEKSLNISDLEASASVAGDLDFDRATIDSNADVDLPELNGRLSDGSDGSMISDPGGGGFGGHASRDSTGLLFDDSPRRRRSGRGGPGYHSQQSRRRYELDDSLDRIHVTKTHSFDDSFNFADNKSSAVTAPPRRTSASDALSERLSQPRDLLSQQRDLMSPPRDLLSQPRDRSQSIADYLLSGSAGLMGGGDNSYQRSSNLSSAELRDELGQLPGRPPIFGESIFTQEDGSEVLSYHQRHSLMEFERLEAAMDGDGHSERSGDQVDLIGAYLQGLQDQEEEDEEEEDKKAKLALAYRRHGSDASSVSHPREEVSSSDRDDSRSDRRGSADRAGLGSYSRQTSSDKENTGQGAVTRSPASRRSIESHSGKLDSLGQQDSTSDRSRSVSRQISRDTERDFQDESVDFDDDEEDEPEEVDEEANEKQRMAKITRKNAVERSDSQLSHQHGTKATEDETEIQRAKANSSVEAGPQGSFEVANDSIPFNDSASLLENQLPPFDSMSFSTLDMTGGTNEAASRNATMSEAGAPPPSRIPMLRSRSPSMTRPGSTSPKTRSRSVTPDHPRGRRRNPPTPPGTAVGEKGRTLPPTPRLNRSPGSSARSVASGGRERSVERKPQRMTSTEDNDDDEDNEEEGYQEDRDEEEPGKSVSTSSDRTRTPRSSKEESELDRATSLLLGEMDPLDLPPTPTARRGSADAATGGRRKSGSVTGGSRPGSARTQRQVAAPPTGGRVRPSSAEGLRSSSKKDFRIRSTASGTLTSQPLRAIGREVEEADRALQEAQQRELNEETLRQLQHDYNTLLQKYAQAENTIDSLRIGATIPINVELTTTGGASAPNAPPSGQLAPAGAGATTNASVGTPAGGSLNNSTHTRPVIGHGSRPGSARSQRSRSNSGQLTQSQLMTGQLASTEQVNLEASLRGEGNKLALLAKAKAVEEKAHALSVLLGENCLSTADQLQALQNIKDSHEQLQQEYRDARAQHDYMIRTGGLPQDTPEFDADKLIEGELYKLGMKMDDIEEQVQQNVKVKSSVRVPFKADHNIDVNGMNGANKGEAGETAQELAPNRPPSVGSFAGGPEDIDEQLHQLSKDYDQLMDRYRRLKQLKKTPERDREIDGLLKNLRCIYEETPDHRKPALPPELENHYNPVKDNFMSSESEAPHRGSLIIYPSKGQEESDSLPGLNASDLSIGRHSQDRRLGPKDSSDLTSSATDSTLRQKRQRRIPTRPPPAPASYDSYDSVPSSPSRKSPLATSRGRYPGTAPPSGRRREREDKDSGYVGSEASRKVAGQDKDRDRLRHAQAQRHPQRSPARSDYGGGGGVVASEPLSRSTSDLSTVEHVRPYRPPGGIRNKKAHSGQEGEGIVAMTGSSKQRAKTNRANSDPALNRRQQPRDRSDSDASSQASGRTSRSRPSVKSEQIQTLADEINKLREEMQRRDNAKPETAVKTAGAVSSEPPAGVAPGSQPLAASQQQPQYALVYGHPVQDYGGQQPPPVGINKENYAPAGGVVYGGQQLAPPGGHQFVTPGVTVGPVVQPDMYADGLRAPTGEYREVQEPGPVERWDTYNSRPDHGYRDHQDRDRDRRSGYYSPDEGGYHRGRDREKDRERRRRLRDYYIPSTSRRDSPNRTYRSTSRDDRYADRYKPDNYFPARPIQPAYSAPHLARPNMAPAPAIPAPPSYQQVRSVVPCATCGGTGQHSHGEVIYTPHVAPPVPVPVPTPQVAPQHGHQNATAGSYVLVPTVQAPANHAAPAQVQPVQRTSSHNGAVYIPVQVVEKAVPSSKVRYYVREYGGDSDVEPGILRRAVSHGNLTNVGRRKVRHVLLEETGSDAEGLDADLNDSLNSALQTASQIKKMSRRMKKTLKSELDQSLRSSLRAMAY